MKKQMLMVGVLLLSSVSLSADNNKMKYFDFDSFCNLEMRNPEFKLNVGDYFMAGSDFKDFEKSGLFAEVKTDQKAYGKEYKAVKAGSMKLYGTFESPGRGRSDGYTLAPETFSCTLTVKVEQ